jgi:hypothetical protein
MNKLYSRTRQVPNYRLFWIIRWYLYCPKSLQATFCWCTYTWGRQLNTGVLHLVIAFIYWFRVIRVFLCVFWSLHSWRWSRKRGSGDNTMVDIQTFLRVFLNASLFHCWNFFLVKSTISSPGTTHLKHWIINISGLMDTRLHKILMYIHIQ